MQWMGKIGLDLFRGSLFCFEKSRMVRLFYDKWKLFDKTKDIALESHMIRSPKKKTLHNL